MVFVLFTLSGLVEVFLCANIFFSNQKKELKPTCLGADIKDLIYSPKFFLQGSTKKGSEAKNICVQIKERDRPPHPHQGGK